MLSCCLKEDLVLPLFVAIFFSLSCASAVKNNQPEVTICQGILRGKILTTYSNRSVSAFLGIPYAQPPIGNLRFANPVAADGWKGTRNATVDSNECPQISLLSKKINGNEDCLYLNVYTPQLPKNSISRLLPVMVFFHGGQFIFGGDTSSVYGPEFLLDKDVILVTLNYRLGPLGYLSTGDKVASGNWGLKDQILALKWVQSNVKYFGGDPDQVTLFGQSAGAGSVHLLTMMDITIGLFHRYITESGSALAAWAYRPSGPYASQAFDLGSYPKFYDWQSFPLIVWGPTDEPNIDGAILTDSPQNLIRNGRVRDLPWVSGVCRDDGLAMSIPFYENETLVDYFLANFDSILPIFLNWKYLPGSGTAWVEDIKSYYFKNFEADKNVILANLTVLVSDVYFNYPAYDALRQQFATAVNPQYFYTFDYRGALSFSYAYGGTKSYCGVPHGEELLYLFPNPQNFQKERFWGHNETRSKKDYEMVNVMVELWTSFATHGTPTSPAFGNNTKWEPFSITKANNLHIGNKSNLGLTVEYPYFKERLQFWDELKAKVPL